VYSGVVRKCLKYSPTTEAALPDFKDDSSH